MTSAFCPGHITCFFHPVRTDRLETTGSRGAGIRLSLGANVTMEERSDSRIDVIMDGRLSDANITRYVIGKICPGRGFDVTIENDLPVGQGFGMSAAGAIAAAMCLCRIVGRDVEDAYLIAHEAEVVNSGGLGDVAAIQCAGKQPVWLIPGVTPNGMVIDTGVNLGDLTLAVTGEKLSTGTVINDPIMQTRMNEIGGRMVDDYSSNPSMERLFSFSREFSTSMDLESDDVRNALDKLNRKGMAGMCMLGHSIFTTLSEDIVRESLGDVPVFRAKASDRKAFIQRE